MKAIKLIEKVNSLLAQDEILPKLTNIQQLIDLHPELEDFYRDALVFLTLLYRNYIVYDPSNIVLQKNGNVIKCKAKFPLDNVDNRFATEYIYGAFKNIKRKDDPNYEPPKNNAFRNYNSLQGGAWQKNVGKAKCVITFNKDGEFNPIFDIEMTCCPKRNSVY